jgi:hypothetical protein
MTKLDKHSEKKYLDPCDTVKFIGALLKQSVERIDKVRSSAGIVLCDLIHQQQDLSFPGHDLLEKCIHT